MLDVWTRLQKTGRDDQASETLFPRWFPRKDRKCDVDENLCEMQNTGLTSTVILLYLKLSYTSMYSEHVEFHFVHLTVICYLPWHLIYPQQFPFTQPSLMQVLPTPTSFHWHPSIFLILPFLSCQILVEAMGQCLTFWRDSKIHRGAEWEFTSHGRVFPSICYNVRSLHCSARREENIMASAHSLPVYYTLTGSDLVCSSECIQIFCQPALLCLAS